jgi:hypothetical protein
MSGREPVEIVEIDMDYCSLDFGVGDCPATLGGAVTHKCFNTFFTCPVREAFDKQVLTYRFVQSRANYPKGQTFFPCLKDVTHRAAIANIAGADKRQDSLGRRARVSASFSDFTYHDRFMDKYQPERVSGEAQLSGVGYDPESKGTFWTKFRARNPNYAGRPMRIITGYVDNGVLTIDTTRHYIITNFSGPDNDGNVQIEGKDILAIAENDRAVVPRPSRGVLTLDLAEDATQFDITPTGIGNLEYPVSGIAAIGAELVQYTRTGDTITLTRRGLNGTQQRSHRQGDTFQLTFSPRRNRIDHVVRDILIEAGVPSEFIPFSDWEFEAGRWASTLRLTADIMKPEGASKLIGELAILGVTIWWDDVDQEIKFLVNRPVDTEIVKDLNDTQTNISVTKEDRDDARLTEVIFRSVQIDPSRGVSDDNFSRTRVTVDVESKLPDAYGDTRIKEINCRWLNQGNDAVIRILSIRYLNRFKFSPVRYVVELDYKDDMSIADVARVTSYKITSATGELQEALAQVTMRNDIVAGHKLEVLLQQFQFDQRYGFITENTRPNYNSSSEAQKNRGAYFVGESGLFDDSEGPYRFI